MGIGSSIALIAVGAILAFAVEFDIAGLDINTVGVILMLAGVVGAILSLTIWGSWGTGRRTVTETYVDDTPRTEVLRETPRTEVVERERR